jgi:hypothetical protein
MQRRVVTLKLTDVSEVRTASIIALGFLLLAPLLRLDNAIDQLLNSCFRSGNGGMQMHSFTYPQINRKQLLKLLIPVRRPEQRNVTERAAYRIKLM